MIVYLSGSKPGDYKWNSSDGDVIPLEPMDLVWAKCTGFPWYPALVGSNVVKIEISIITCKLCNE